MPVSDEYIQFVLDQLSSLGGVTARRMFGGAGLFRDGTMFGLVADDVAYLKVDDSNRNMYEAAGAKRFRPYPDKPETMSYYDVPAEVLESRDTFAEWAEASARIPPKTPGGKRRRNSARKMAKKRPKKQPR